jgi:hypothetical protein
MDSCPSYVLPTLELTQSHGLALIIISSLTISDRSFIRYCGGIHHRELSSSCNSNSSETAILYPHTDPMTSRRPLKWHSHLHLDSISTSQPSQPFRPAPGRLCEHALVCLPASCVLQTTLITMGVPISPNVPALVRLLHGTLERQAYIYAWHFFPRIPIRPSRPHR